MFCVVGYLFGVKNPYDQTDAQLKRAKEFLISKKKLVRNIWSNEGTMNTDFASGNVWIAYAWPADYWNMLQKKLKVRYMLPKEKPISWVGMFMLLKNTKRYHLAHAYVDAWSSRKSAKWLEDNYSYGHANIKARPSSSAKLQALHLGNPRAVAEPYAHMDRDTPRRELYLQLWDEVKRS
jgi:spermidine/putrescine-binding protein